MSNIITRFCCFVLIKEHLNVNGTGQVEIHNSYTKKNVFLSQFMLRHDGEVTVRQYLLLAALMKMPRNTKNMAKFERVEQIISMVCTMKRIILPDVIGYLNVNIFIASNCSIPPFPELYVLLKHEHELIGEVILKIKVV